MKSIIKYTAWIMLITFTISGCKKYEHFQKNPNYPSMVDPSQLLTGICYELFYINNADPDYASRYLAYFERGNSSVDYSWNTSSFDDYNTLRQVMRMDSLAKATDQQQYLGLTKLFRAILFSQLTETFGDIPYSEAMLGLGNPKPAYDNQESIYKGLLQELDEANTLLDNTKGEIKGDIVYGGFASQWKKMANAFKLRLLIHLSRKESNTNLNIKTQFQNIISDPVKYPLFENNADNAKLAFNESAQNNYYPTYGYQSLSTEVRLEKGFAKILKDRSDPRLFALAEPISGLPANDFNNYEGVDAGLPFTEQKTFKATTSGIKSRYYTNKINEPWIFIGYAEQEFLIAEAISRNWITGAGTAKEHYEKGIAASMNFYNVNIGAYLSNPLVDFDAANALSQIAIQKYIAMFMNSSWEAFIEQRRTGIPTFSVGPGTLNDGKVPKRWLYPDNERTNNSDNVTQAIQSQFGGTDDTNAEMWLIK
ncbi:MAG: SusD/RagB family nutrient-binding outer membrane lipoprotein [Ferruginibacter sp.]